MSSTCCLMARRGLFTGSYARTALGLRDQFSSFRKIVLCRIADNPVHRIDEPLPWNLVATGPPVEAIALATHPVQVP